MLNITKNTPMLWSGVVIEFNGRLDGASLNQVVTSIVANLASSRVVQYFRVFVFLDVARLADETSRRQIQVPTTPNPGLKILIHSHLILMLYPIFMMNHSTALISTSDFLHGSLLSRTRHHTRRAVRRWSGV